MEKGKVFNQFISEDLCYLEKYGTLKDLCIKKLLADLAKVYAAEADKDSIETRAKYMDTLLDLEICTYYKQPVNAERAEKTMIFGRGIGFVIDRLEYLDSLRRPLQDDALFRGVSLELVDKATLDSQMEREYEILLEMRVLLDYICKRVPREEVLERIADINEMTRKLRNGELEGVDVSQVVVADKRPTM